MNKGLFITFEGVEGSGKSTHIATLAKKLEGLGHKVTTTREPGGTPVGMAIRSILLDPATGEIDPVTELLLFSAARSELVTTVIIPALDNGDIVLCDRFVDSTFAYQGGARGIDFAGIKGMAMMTCKGVWPIRTIVLDIPVETGLDRAKSRNKDNNAEAEGRFEKEDLDFHIRVSQSFREIASVDPQRVRVVSSEPPVEEVSKKVFEAIEDLLEE